MSSTENSIGNIEKTLDGLVTYAYVKSEKQGVEQVRFVLDYQFVKLFGLLCDRYKQNTSDPVELFNLTIRVVNVLYGKGGHLPSGYTHMERWCGDTYSMQYRYDTNSESIILSASMGEGKNEINTALTLRRMWVEGEPVCSLEGSVPNQNPFAPEE